ncbi:TIGR01459 family HAD-type hydrolase, partial [Mesorhizobium sp. M1C.F.Ca.ET.204.01.1.1]|uniref:TIGR01459 family HAD-type hydrolase n=1 Tax=Mesorhizobium sp. M1C.F.Ca.ET.204.01.1.1 TaxID=2563929 RepID=UPI001093552F
MSAKQAKHLDGIAALAERYGVFLLDQFGVLHDGQAPYPGAVEALSTLKRAGKTVVLISNSGKRARPNEDRLLKLGFEVGSWDHFVSSGEVAWRRFHDMAAA